MNHQTQFRPAGAPLPGLLASESIPSNESRFLLFRGEQLLVKATTSGVMLCKAWPKRIPPHTVQLIGHIHQLSCYATNLPSAGPGALAQQGPPGHAFRDLRALFGLLSEEEYAAAVTARELLHWEESARHCTRCGAALARDPERFCKRCPTCTLTSEPTVHPMMLLLIHDGPRVLLAQPHGLPSDMFSLPAVETAPGEALEQTATRFLERSFGLSVSQWTYHESQPWPYPDRLLLGFHGHAAAGPLSVDPREFAAVRWFHVDDLPILPPPISLARRMADWYAQLPRVDGAPSLPQRGHASL